ncbi:MAG: hypothetical protein V1849_01095 [Chloroflexota bacterium]
MNPWSPVPIGVGTGGATGIPVMSKGIIAMNVSAPSTMTSTEYRPFSLISQGTHPINDPVDIEDLAGAVTVKIYW